MGKASSCILMLQYLNTGKTYKISELSKLLNVNSRNIVVYKDTLVECGYPIVSKLGRYGGYKLDKAILLPILKLEKKDIEVLNKGVEYILSKDDFLDKDEFLNIISKIFSSISEF